MAWQSERLSARRDLLVASGAFVVAVALWQVQELYFLLYPLRLFVTMVHELAHGIAAELTGGTFLHFEVTSRGAGLAYTRGGARFVIIQAGYLGTAFFGALVLYLTHRTRWPGRVAIGLGVFLGILTLAYSDIHLSRLHTLEKAVVFIVLILAVYLVLTRETNEGRYAGISVGVLGALLLVRFAGRDNWLTIVVGMGSALLLIWMGIRASRDIVTVVLTFLAILCGLQAITDAWVLLKIVSLPGALVPVNDASAMASEIGGPAALWALLWVGGDVVIFGASVYMVFSAIGQDHT